MGQSVYGCLGRLGRHVVSRYSSKIVDVRNQLTDRKYIALLAAVAGIILVLGTWARPRPRQDDACLLYTSDAADE